MSKADYTKKIAILRQHRNTIRELLEEALYNDYFAPEYYSLAVDLNFRIDEEEGELIDLQE